MSTQFTVEESNLICVFAGENRKEVIEEINGALPYLYDEEMIELSYRVLGKLEKMPDNVFLGLELEAAE